VVNELPTNVVLFEKFPVVLIIILAVKTLPSLFLQLNLIVKLNWFIKEHEFKEAFKLEELENWRVKFGKVKFSGKTIWSNFRHKMFKRTSLPRSIWSCKSLNLIGSSNFVLHFRELQFDVGDGRSGFEINKIKLLLFCFDPLLKTWQDLLLICYILIESCVYLVANLK
jgi:hypothetical protein